jgi:hypothetical protein
MSKNLIFAQKMTKLWACQISQNKKNTLYKTGGLRLDLGLLDDGLKTKIVANSSTSINLKELSEAL